MTIEGDKKFQRDPGPVVGFRYLPILCAALVAIALTAYFFPPRVILWRLLGTAEILPETARAGDALRQLANPFVTIDSPTNRVLNWRLLFPVIGHYLHFPPALYLALPQIGALVTALYFVGILRRNGLDWLLTTAATVVLLSAPWFFVSEGWLGYFDSWCILGLSLVAFARSPRTVAAAVLIVPWIDERFVLTLPLCLVLRAMQVRRAASGGPTGRDATGNGFGQIGVIAIALAPWALVRIISYFRGTDPVLGAHWSEMVAAHQKVGFQAYAEGLWQGARWGWLAICALVFSVRRSGWAWVVVGGLAVTLAVNLAVAEDLSRSASVIAPATLAGLLEMRGWSAMPDLRRYAIPGIAAFNLLTPAEHVIGPVRVPIYYLPAELRRNQQPFSDYSAQISLRNGIALAQAGQHEQAIVQLDMALRLEPTSVEALTNRSIEEGKLKQWPPALADANRAIELFPDAPDLWMNRAAVRAGSGDQAGAKADLTEALRRSEGKDWARRAQAQQLLQRLP